MTITLAARPIIGAIVLLERIEGPDGLLLRRSVPDDAEALGCAVFVDDRVAGGYGLHRRIAPDGLEIGYWIHPTLVRRGPATRVGGC